MYGGGKKAKSSAAATAQPPAPAPNPSGVAQGVLPAPPLDAHSQIVQELKESVVKLKAQLHQAQQQPRHQTPTQPQTAPMYQQQYQAQPKLCRMCQSPWPELASSSRQQKRERAKNNLSREWAKF